MLVAFPKKQLRVADSLPKILNSAEKDNCIDRLSIKQYLVVQRSVVL